MRATRSMRSFDPRRLGRLEVEWWRVHRHLQRDAPAEAITPLVDALAALYAHVFAGG